MDPYRIPPYLTAFGASQEQDGDLDSSVGMERTDSRSSGYTVDSAYTIDTSSSAPSSATDYSTPDFTFPSDGAYRSASISYPDPASSYDAHDPNHILSAAGSQYQQTGHQLPQALYLPGPLLPLTTRAGWENVARQATHAAHLVIFSQPPFWDGRPRTTMITSEAVDEAIQKFQAQGSGEAVRQGVQSILYQLLGPLFHDIETFYANIIQLLEEAAYHLQTRLQGLEALDICYYAIVAVLAALMGDPEDDMKVLTSTGLGPAGLQGANPSPVPSPAVTEKERFKCHHPGCDKGASRQADLERHYNNVHLDNEQKTKYLCDYKKCNRHELPFFRQDHFRDHLRIYHKEDLLRRGSKGDAEWWESRAPRPIFCGWWRCSRCLVRVALDKHGFVCHGCGSQCEKERQRYRMETPNPLLQGEGRNTGRSRLDFALRASSSGRKRPFSST